MESKNLIELSTLGDLAICMGIIMPWGADCLIRCSIVGSLEFLQSELNVALNLPNISLVAVVTTQDQS